MLSWFVDLTWLRCPASRVGPSLRIRPPSGRSARQPRGPPSGITSSPMRSPLRGPRSLRYQPRRSPPESRGSAGVSRAIALPVSRGGGRISKGEGSCSRSMVYPVPRLGPAPGMFRGPRGTAPRTLPSLDDQNQNGSLFKANPREVARCP